MLLLQSMSTQLANFCLKNEAVKKDETTNASNLFDKLSRGLIEDTKPENSKRQSKTTPNKFVMGKS